MISKQHIALTALYFICIGSYLLNWELVFILTFVFNIILFNTVVSYAKFIILPMLLIIGLGLIHSVNNNVSLVIKDLMYFLNPLNTLIAGFTINKYFKLNEIAKHIVIISTILAFVYILRYDPTANLDAINDIKREQGVANLMITLGLTILIISKDARSFFDKRIVSLILFLLITATVISFSRTLYLILITLLLFGLNFFRISKSIFFKFLLGLVAIFAVVTVLSNIGTDDRDTFIGKLRTSFQEITIQNQISRETINSNWRGFEAYKGFEQYKKGNTFEFIIGQGFGASAPLGFKMPLGDVVFEEIPKFHNGYITLLLKTGILGLLIYFITFFRIIIKQGFINDTPSIVSNLIAGIAAVILITTFVIAGWLNQSSLTSVILIFGFLIAENKKLNLVA